jgi:transposase-like protein
MGLSRRQFTKEFKLAAVRRLEQGVAIAEVARALEVNPNVRELSATMRDTAGR